MRKFPPPPVRIVGWVSSLFTIWWEQAIASVHVLFHLRLTGPDVPTSLSPFFASFCLHYYYLLSLQSYPFLSKECVRIAVFPWGASFMWARLHPWLMSSCAKITTTRMNKAVKQIAHLSGSTTYADCYGHISPANVIQCDLFPPN